MAFRMAGAYEVYRSYNADIKQIDEQEHIKLTGHSNKNILAMARELSDMKKPVWIRHVLVPGGSDKDEYLHRLADFIHTLSNVERVEVLPYHTLGKFKWENLGLSYPLEGLILRRRKGLIMPGRFLELSE